VGCSPPRATVGKPLRSPFVEASPFGLAILIFRDIVRRPEFVRLAESIAAQTLKRCDVEHELHFIDASDELCKRQLKDRTKHLPPGTPWTTDTEFDAITLYFQPPSDDEAFNVVRHARS